MIREANTVFIHETRVRVIAAVFCLLRVCVCFVLFCFFTRRFPSSPTLTILVEKRRALFLPVVELFICALASLLIHRVRLRPSKESRSLKRPCCRHDATIASIIDIGEPLASVRRFFRNDLRARKEILA